MLHIPRNICLAFSGVSYLNTDDVRLFFLFSTGGQMLIHGIAYPFLTIQRRLECQSSLPTLLPQKYKGFFNAFKQIVKQEGFRALYKGFIAYSLAITIWVFSVPAIAQLNMLNSPWAKEDKRDISFRGEVNPMMAYEDEAEDLLDEDLRAAMSSKSHT